jgi:uncharacterized protein YcbK (DUF882 family)
MIFHAHDIAWNPDRWPDFTPQEMACRCCGEMPYLPAEFDAVQHVRQLLARPLILFSAYRCPLHNARVGGAPLSQHKTHIAFDISLAGHNLADLLAACRQSGFTGFGYYQTFLHVDHGRPRRWWSKGGQKTWHGLIF